MSNLGEESIAATATAEAICRNNISQRKPIRRAQLTFCRRRQHCCRTTTTTPPRATVVTTPRPSLATSLAVACALLVFFAAAPSADAFLPQATRTSPCVRSSFHHEARNEGLGACCSAISKTSRRLPCSDGATFARYVHKCKKRTPRVLVWFRYTAYDIRYCRAPHTPSWHKRSFGEDETEIFNDVTHMGASTSVPHSLLHSLQSAVEDVITPDLCVSVFSTDSLRVTLFGIHQSAEIKLKLFALLLLLLHAGSPRKICLCSNIRISTQRRVHPSFVLLQQLHNMTS